MKYKKLSQEDDLTLWDKYYRFSSFLSYREMAFFIFMAVLYYSGYARWLFWFLLIIVIIGLIRFCFDGLPLYSYILKEELKRRGYK